MGATLQLQSTGSSLWWLLLLWTGSRAHRLSSCGSQYLWHTGLAALRHLGSSWTRDRTHVSCIGRQILYHWTTREAPSSIFFFLNNIKLDSVVFLKELRRNSISECFSLSPWWSHIEIPGSPSSRISWKGSGLQAVWSVTWGCERLDVLALVVPLLIAPKAVAHSSVPSLGSTHPTHQSSCHSEDKHGSQGGQN